MTGPESMPVAVVEDHPLMAETLSRSLAAQGLAALVVDPAECVALAPSLAGHLVLLDLDLGEALFGDDMVEPLVAAGARVVLLTGVTDRVRLGEALERGAEGVIGKKLPPTEVVAAVLACAEGRPALAVAECDAMVDEAVCARMARRRMLQPFETLTAREGAVLAALAEGLAAADIADRHAVAIKTVHAQIGAILSKLGVHSQLAAVAMAERSGWAPAPA